MPSNADFTRAREEMAQGPPESALVKSAKVDGRDPNSEMLALKSQVNVEKIASAIKAAQRSPAPLAPKLPVRRPSL
jgi:hypothetical protein